jgi:hypothetical protein
MVPLLFKDDNSVVIFKENELNYIYSIAAKELKRGPA